MGIDECAEVMPQSGLMPPAGTAASGRFAFGATRAAVAGLVTMTLCLAGASAGTAFANTPEPRTGPATGKGAGGSSVFVNSPTRALGVTPEGVKVTVEKKMINGARITSAGVLRADPSAPDDEFLIPRNAKAVAAINDLYEGFSVKPNAWNDIATLKFTFSSPVHNPRLHIAGTGGAVADLLGNRDAYWSGIEVVGGSPAVPTFTKVAGFPDYTVTRTEVIPTKVSAPDTTRCGIVYMCGSVQLNGTLDSFTIKVKARNVRPYQSAGDPFFWGAFRVSLSEDSSDAPTSYGAATHVVGDGFIGSEVTADNTERVSFYPRQLSANADLDQLLGRQGVITAERGDRIAMDVPVSAKSPAVLAGWIDFNRNGTYDRSERAETTVSPNRNYSRLMWVVPDDARTGTSWARLRMAASSAQVVTPTGWAENGEVEDHPVIIAPRPVPPRRRGDVKRFVPPNVP